MSTRPASTLDSASASAQPPLDEEGRQVLGPSLKKKVLVEGHGPKPVYRADVKVHYTGRLLDGTKFDSSLDRNDPFVFKLGMGQVIKGWDEGVATMRVGEKAILTCAPEYAYGARGSPPKIPPNATLEFEVELLSFDATTKVTEDGGVKKNIVAEGTGANKPTDLSTVRVRYTGRVRGEDTPFISRGVGEDQGVELVLGSDPEGIWGLEEAVKNMLPGERATVYVQPQYGFGEKGHAALRVPPNSELEFDVELLSFTRAPDNGELDFAAKLARMKQLKDFGNGLFKAGVSLDRAMKVYRQAVDVFPYDGALDDEQKSAVNSVKVAAMSNHALCKLKQSRWEDVVAHANAAIAIEPRHVKALFYRGQARHKLGQLAEAESDFKTAADADPKNAEVRRELAAVRAKLKSIADREKAAFGGFFNKIKLVSPEEEARAAREAEEARKRAAMADDDSDSGVSSGNENEDSEDDEAQHPPTSADAEKKEGASMSDEAPAAVAPADAAAAEPKKDGEEAAPMQTETVAAQ